MPYIPEGERHGLWPRTVRTAREAGQLNYQLTSLCNAYLLNNGRSYAIMNDIVGALEGAKAEFQRQVVAPYEDEKILANGGIYA